MTETDPMNPQPKDPDAILEQKLKDLEAFTKPETAKDTDSDS